MKNILYLAIIALFASCASQRSYQANDASELVPLSKDLLDKFPGVDLSRGQMYISGVVEMMPKNDSLVLKIEEGKFKISEHTFSIIIPNHTGGQVIKQGPEELWVKFRPDDRYYLIFRVDPKRQNNFYLSAKVWNQNQGYAEIEYGPRSYVIPYAAGNIKLLIDKSYEQWIKKQTEPGVEVH